MRGGTDVADSAGLSDEAQGTVYFLPRRGSSHEEVAQAAKSKLSPALTLLRRLRPYAQTREG
jgi:hypothetical protein